jgi:hypothetical protein
VLKGQVVYSLCWFEADRKTTAYGTGADLKCAAACSDSGIPTALAVTGEHDATLCLLEDSAFEKSDKGWLAYVDKYVEVIGIVREKEGTRKRRCAHPHLSSQEMSTRCQRQRLPELISAEALTSGIM